MRQSAGRTDIGQRRRTNQDAFLLDADLGLYVVADGMGGHAAGEVASQEAIATVHGMVQRESSRLECLEDPAPEAAALQAAARLLEGSIQAATYMIFAMAQHEPDQLGMGTTLSAMVLRGRHAIIGQVGDSRIYLIRDQQAVLLTEDHTLVGWQLKQGIITAEEAAISPHRNVITRAIGSREYVQVDIHLVETEPGDAFLLCSDGLHGYVDDAEIPEIVARGPQASVDAFIELANERGGRDNITAVVVALS